MVGADMLALGWCVPLPLRLTATFIFVSRSSPPPDLRRDEFSHFFSSARTLFAPSDDTQGRER